MTQAFPHDGLLGGLNLLKRTDCQQLLNPGDRPPYPIIIHCPTLRQIVENMNRADIAIFVFYTMIGFPISKKIVKGPSVSEYMRRTSFRLTWSAFMSFGVFNAVVNSNYRLTGLINNGLSWKRKEEDLKKYDFTTDYMQGTVWKFFRLKTDDANK